MCVLWTPMRYSSPSKQVLMRTRTKVPRLQKKTKLLEIENPRKPTDSVPSSPAPLPPPPTHQKNPGNKFPHTRKPFLRYYPLSHPSSLPNHTPSTHPLRTPHTHHTHTHPKPQTPRTPKTLKNHNPQSPKQKPNPSLLSLPSLSLPPAPLPFPLSSPSPPPPPPTTTTTLLHPSPSILPLPPSCPALPFRYRLEERTVLFLVTFRTLGDSVRHAVRDARI